MNDFDIQDPVHIKEQHSEIFTLRSISSQEQLLEVIPLYHKPDSSEQYKSGHWSAKEHIKYIMFIDYFSDIFTIKHNKKLWKIFTIMSAFIKTRNSSQCRSHHQKNQRKQKSIQEILELQRSRYKNYSTQFEKMKKVLRKLPIHNPIEVDNQKSTMALIPSIKVLEQNLEYQVYKNPTSMKDIQIQKKDLEQIKNRNSQKIITINKKKYIGSEVSIQMENQSQEGQNERVRSLYVNQIEAQKCKEKNICNYNSSGMDSYQKKDEKLDKTADTYMDEGAKNLIKNNMKPGLNPVEESQNSDAISQSMVQNVRNYINFVQIKKTRSSLPSFDDFALDRQEVAILGKRLRNLKKESRNSQGKCKTLPLQSAKAASSEDSWLSQKKSEQKTIRKSLFFQFVSSLEESNKAFQVNQKFFNQSNRSSFGNFSYENEFQAANDKMMDFRRPESLPERDHVEPTINLFLCDDHYNGNHSNQISVGQYENSKNFVDPNALKVEDHPQKQPQMQKLESCVRNFTKKRSREPESISQQKEQEIEKNKDPQPIKRLGSNEICPFEHHLNTQSQNLFSNSDQLIPSMQIPYQMPFIYSQNPVMQISSLYNSYWFVPQQYPLLEYELHKFIEFFIYFLCHKIVANNFYFPIQ